MSAEMQSVSMDRDNSPSTSGSAPPTPLLDQQQEEEELGLSDQEFAVFGDVAVDDPLPAPPRDAASIAAAAAAAAAAAQAGGGALGSATLGLPAVPGAKPVRAGGAGAPGRGKRPKNVKFSPGKGGKPGARRVGAPNGKEDKEVGLPNNDFCDACQGKGIFLCCDGGCLRSFHFACLDPPLEMDEVPDEAWFCKSCQAIKDPPPKPPRGFFRELIHKIDCENPKVFELPQEVKALYKNVATGGVGEYIDVNEHRPPSKTTGRAIGQEDRDGLRLKDKAGKPILCYQCNEPASAQTNRKILSCDFCDNHWHLDCIDPPMAALPPPTRKWMCPLHPEQILPRRRIPRATTTIDVRGREVGNNGDILVLPRREPRALDDDRYEELTVNRVRYQVPEEILILDFWGRLQHSRRALAKMEAAKAEHVRAVTSESRASRQPSAEPSGEGGESFAERNGISSNLDSLALLAEVRYADLHHQQSSIDAAGDSIMRDTSAPISLPTSSAADFNKSVEPVSQNSARKTAENRKSLSSSTGELVIPPFTPKPNQKTMNVTGHTDTKERVQLPTPGLADGSDLSVGSKEDLHALMRVRKLVQNAEESEAGKKQIMLSFLQGGPVLPRLDFMRREVVKQPWELPWGDSQPGI